MPKVSSSRRHRRQANLMMADCSPLTMSKLFSSCSGGGCISSTPAMEIWGLGPSTPRKVSEDGIEPQPSSDCDSDSDSSSSNNNVGHSSDGFNPVAAVAMPPQEVLNESSLLSRTSTLSSEEKQRKGHIRRPSPGASCLFRLIEEDDEKSGVVTTHFADTIIVSPDDQSTRRRNRNQLQQQQQRATSSLSSSSYRADPAGRAFEPYPRRKNKRQQMRRLLLSPQHHRRRKHSTKFPTLPPCDRHVGSDSCAVDSASNALQNLSV